MRPSEFDRSTLGICVVAALLTGCAVSQPPGAMPQSRVIAMHAAHGASWMLPEAKSEDLLYVSRAIYTKGNSLVLVFSYPRGKAVGTLTGFSDPTGECVDKNGDVFITDSNASGVGYVYEYAHGGKTPITTLNDPLTWPLGCSVDAMTGSLAVINAGGVAVFPNAQGNPTTYTDPSFNDMRYGGYDKQGNLFVDGEAAGSIYFGFAELPTGKARFTDISVNGAFTDAGAVQWDGRYIAVQTLGSGRSPALIYRLQVSGSTATIVGTTTLRSNRNRYNGGQFWIQGSRVIGPDNSGETVAFWKYPAGGRGLKTIKNVGTEAWGITVSLAPNR
jgi:hypothetical protein